MQLLTLSTGASDGRIVGDVDGPNVVRDKVIGNAVGCKVNDCK